MKISGLLEAFVEVIAWLIIAATAMGFFFVVLMITPVLLFFAWNKGIAPVLSLPEITMLQSFMITLFFSIIGKMFTAESSSK